MYVSTLWIPNLLHLHNFSQYKFDKTITTDTPNLLKLCILYMFRWLRWQLLPIMLALCSMLLPSYYAQNYPGIIGSSLVGMDVSILPEKLLE